MAPRHALTFEAGLHDGSGTPRAIHSKGAEQTLGPACPMMMRAHSAHNIHNNATTPPFSHRRMHPTYCFVCLHHRGCWLIKHTLCSWQLQLRIIAGTRAPKYPMRQSLTHTWFLLPQMWTVWQSGRLCPINQMTSCSCNKCPCLLAHTCWSRAQSNLKL